MRRLLSLLTTGLLAVQLLAQGLCVPGVGTAQTCSMEAGAMSADCPTTHGMVAEDCTLPCCRPALPSPADQAWMGVKAHGRTLDAAVPAPAPQLAAPAMFWRTVRMPYPDSSPPRYVVLRVFRI